MANSGEYYQTPYDFNNIHHYNHHHYHQQQPHYNQVSYHQYQYQYQPQFGYNPIGYHQQQPQFGYDPVSFDWNRSEFETISSSIAYSVSNSSISEPKSFFYDPNLYTIYESPPQFSIYSSVHQSNEPEFNEPEFDEYDPTPYGGGYDIVSTYGKPLTPSEVTCYPPVNSSPAKPLPPPVFVAPDRAYGGGGNKNEVKNHGFVSESTKLPKPLEAIEEEEEDEDEEEDDEESSYGSEQSENVDKGAAKSVEAIEDEDGDDQASSNGSEKSRKVEENEVKAQYVPSGYGLEATDLCEAIFGGYFPCVLRNKRREQQSDDREASRNVSCWESNDLDPWEQTSDYIFGDLYPYGYENQTERNRFERPGYGYQRY